MEPQLVTLASLARWPVECVTVGAKVTGGHIAFPHRNCDCADRLSACEWVLTSRMLPVLIVSTEKQLGAVIDRIPVVGTELVYNLLPVQSDLGGPAISERPPSNLINNKTDFYKSVQK